MSKSKIFFFLFLLFAIPTFSQDKSSAGEPGMEPSSEIDKKNVGTNLEKKYYFQISQTFKDKNILNIRHLNTVINNFGDSVPNSKQDLEKIKKDYQVALRYYYRRAYILSGKQMLDVDRNSNELFKKFSNFYEKQTDELLTSVADAVVTLEQKENVEPGNEKQSRYRDIQESEFKLKIAYYNMGKADEMNREARYYDALVHYRIAKEYGVKILTDLELDANKKKEIAKKYETDLNDARGLSVQKGT